MGNKGKKFENNTVFPDSSPVQYSIYSILFYAKSRILQQNKKKYGDYTDQSRPNLIWNLVK